MIRLLKFLAVLSCLTAALCAQTVAWQPAGGTLAQGETTSIELVFEDCAPKQTPPMPTISGLQFGEPSTSNRSSFNIVNGSASRSSTVTVSYPVIATASLGSSITIPALNIDTDKGRLTAAAVTYKVGQNTVGNIARSRFLPPNGDIWAGQVFPLTYILEADKSRLYQVSNNIDWTPSPLLAEDWPERPEQSEILQNGVRTVRITYRTLASASTAGDLQLSPANQLLSVADNNASGGFFGQPSLRRMLVTTEPVTLKVKPLPAPAPAAFTGIIGEFKLTANAVPLDAQVGEPVTWTLTLEGIGNWPTINALPSREVSKDFRVVQPQAKRTLGHEGSLYSATLSEDVVLIPTAPGTHTLGPVSLTIFDPARGEYRTLTTEKFTVNVTGTAPQPPAAPTPAPAAGTPNTPRPPAPPAPTKPTGSIPLDPLSDAPVTSAPIATSRLVVLCAIPFCIPPLLWLVFAIRRSRQTDPVRPLREARERLGRTLDQIAQQPSPELVRAWRDDTARLWQLPVATPTPRDFPDPVWGALWAESERVLYRRDTDIAPQWIAQARQVLAVHHVPSWSVFQLFRARNLFPWLVAVALLLITVPTLPAQPAADYAAGDFAKAESAWRERIQESPTDWSARYNLSLAVAQQSRWDEAAAHAVVAWLQNPRSHETRWQLALASTKSSKVTAAFAPFVIDEPTLAARLAGLASPTEWQLILIASAMFAALALTLGILSGYALPAARGAWVLLPVALLIAAAAILALRTYVPLTAIDTVLVWQESTLYSVPSEATTEQQTTTVKAGTLAQVGKDFLGWRQITLPDGQTGWLRADSLTGLWQTP